MNNNFTSEAYLINISNTLGTTGMDYLTLKDGKIMREAITDLKSESAISELENIRAEIIQVANEEKIHDEKWALGLRYAVKIIDKSIAKLKGDKEW